MTDIAQLGFAVSTGELEKGKAALEAMVPAAARASQAAVAVARADLDRAKASLAATQATEGATRAEIAAADMAVKKANAVLSATRAELSHLNAVNLAAAGMTKEGAAARSAAAGITTQGAAAEAAVGKLNRLGAAANDNINRMQATPSNIAAQFQDIGVTAAAGMNPLLIALQQGTQLSAAFAGGMDDIGAALKQVFSPMALLTIGAVALVVALIQMVDWTALAKNALNGLADVLQEAAPYLVVFAAGLALIYAPAVLTGIWALATAFYGLAAGILATIGLPVLLVAGLVAVVAAANIFRDELTDIFGFDIVAAAAQGINMIVGFFVGAFNSTVAIWAQLPAVIGDLVFQTANMVLDSINRQVNGTIEIINGLMGKLPFGVGENLTIDYRANLQVANPYGGSAGGIARTVGNEMSSAQGVDYVGKGVQAIRSGADYLANKLRGLADGIGGGEKGKAAKGASAGKTEGEKFSDIVTGAENDIAKEIARGKAIELSAEAAAKLEFQTRLLNEAHTKGIALTGPMIAKIDQLADAYSRAKVAADNAVALRDVLKTSDARNAEIQAQIDLVGKYGIELAYAAEMAKLLADASKKMTPDALKAAMPQFEQRATATAARADMLANLKFMEDAIQAADKQTFAFERQRGEVGLTKEALFAYRYETNLLSKAMQEHITLSDAQTAAIQAAAAAYGEQAQAAKELEEQTGRVIDQLENMIGLLDGIGGMGGALGGLLNGLKSGSFSGFGPIGGIADILLSGKKGDYAKQADVIADRIADVFGTSGKFAKTMGTLLQGAAVGSIAGSLVGDSTGNQIGSALGGALGNKIGSSVGKAVGGALGSVLGAAIPIIGGLLGGLLGGLFSKAKTGSASVTQGGISLGGNNAEARGNTNTIAGSVQSSISKIIEALGGTAGDYGFSVGMRKDEFRVSGSAGADVTGKNPNNLLYRGKDANEAARVALLNAINDGAVAGIREGASNLLKAGQDLESAITKVLKFNQVFDDLAKELDPVKYAMDAVGKEASKLTALFTEAGASEADFANLTQLLAIKQAKTYADAIRPQRELEIQIMQLEGKAAEALAMSRQIELDGMNATLRPFQERINALTDEAEAIAAAAAASAAAAEAAKQLQAANDNLIVQILDAQGNDEMATAMKRMIELNSITEKTTRDLTMQLYAAEDAAQVAQVATQKLSTARDVLLDSYQRERSVLVGLSNDMHNLAASLLAVRQSIYANDNAKSIVSVKTALATNDASAAGTAVSAYLASARDSASSMIDYRREMGRVAGLVDGAISKANAAAAGYDAQIALLDQQVNSLIDISSGVVSVKEAIAEYTALMVPPTTEMSDLQREAAAAAAQFQKGLLETTKMQGEEAKAAFQRLIELAAKMDVFWKRVEGDGIIVKGDPDQPIYTVAA